MTILKGNSEWTSKYLLRQLLACSSSCLLSLSCGFTLGISAVLLPQLRNDKGFQYNEDDYSWIASMSPLSMIIGSLTIGTIQDMYGRKAAHILIGVPYIIGWFLIAFANSSTWILIGRFISGIAGGSHRPLTLVYIGEITDPKYRSIYLSLPSLLSNIGVLLCHLIGGYIYWRTATLILAIPAVLGTINFFFLKESPLWFIAKGRNEEACKTFKWFRGFDDKAKLELATIIERQRGKENTSLKETINLIISKSFLKPFFVLVVLMLNIQLSGVNVFHFYSQDIYEKTFKGKIDSFMLMIITDLIRGTVSLLICFAAKMMPKKKCYVAFNFCVIISLIVLIVYNALRMSTYMWISVVSLIVYVAFSSGIVTVGWCFVPEVMPNKLRGFGSGLTSALGFLFLFLIVKTTPGIMYSYNEVGLFGVFAVSSGVTLFILLFTLPETDGKTLQSIEDSYSKGNFEQHKI